MRLEKISLTNFRCFQSLEIDLHPRMTILVADNGGGKTSVLDAIALGFSPLLRALSSANQRLSGPILGDTDIRLLPNQICADSANILLAAKLPNESQLKWEVSQKSSSIANNENQIAQQQLRNYANAILEHLIHGNNETTLRPDETISRVPVIAYYGTARGHIDIPVRLKKTRKTEVKEVKYAFATSALYQSLATIPDFREMLRWFDQEEATELRATRDGLQYINSTLLEEVRNAISLLLQGHYCCPHFDSDHKFVIFDQHTRTRLQVAQLSQGYQSMLALAMDFSRRLCLAGGSNDSEAIMLIDEVDLHLHPSWQQRIVLDLRRTFPNTQFILTTHSPEILTTVRNENIRILKQDSEGSWSAQIPETPEVIGVENATAMNDIMEVNAKPEIAETRLYNDYIVSIENGEHETAEGMALRQQLLALYGPMHPLLRDADRLIRFQRLKLKSSASQSGRGG